MIKLQLGDKITAPNNRPTTIRRAGKPWWCEGCRKDIPQFEIQGSDDYGFHWCLPCLTGQKKWRWQRSQ
ncbi:MAG: hypothetical protein ABIH46_11515 [Chloroflexota bacterium]